MFFGVVVGLLLFDVSRSISFFVGVLAILSNSQREMDILNFCRSNILCISLLVLTVWPLFLARRCAEAARIVYARFLLAHLIFMFGRKS